MLSFYTSLRSLCYFSGIDSVMDFLCNVFFDDLLWLSYKLIGL